MKILVKTITNVEISLDVEPSDTIAQVKAKIEEKDNSHPPHKILIFGGEVVDDEKTLAECGIQNESCVMMIFKFNFNEPKKETRYQIYIKSRDRMDIGLLVDPSDSIEKLKTEIQDRLGISPDQQRLVAAGVVLEDHKTLGEYQILDESTIELED